ncbi:MAG: ABC transporter ATP-binding protein [Reyranella sp.]|uniref:ABC transporter ATP-binding protein n=1 Tax=Reyranella sp. TaxID=1929291 RepID=UPI001200AAE2|nr:ABC transporter ATP-binding protein [Reyranella sp.]TAJ37646.1 MAG: ABC transporter ATP-binding protein [Reyranella sp.]
MTHPLPRRTEPRGENVLPFSRHRETLLSLADISLARNGHSVLDHVSFDLGRGETLGLVGESGAGKSTIALAAMGLLRPPAVTLEGRMQFAEHENLLAEPEAEWATLRGRRIAMIFQDPASALNPCFTVGRQLESPLRRLLGFDRAAARRRAIELLESAGLNDAEARLAAFPHELSGGMQQRVMIAIALSCNPELLLADEPTSALDVTIQAQIMQLILEQVRARNASCIFVLHDLALASQVCDRIVVLYAGQVVEAGPAESVLRRSLHPYTNALKSCVIELDTETLTPPEGGLPALGAMPPGCRFASRCPRATARCADQMPPLRSLEGREIACWHPG